MFKATISFQPERKPISKESKRGRWSKRGRGPRNRFDKEITTPANYARPRVTNGAIDRRRIDRSIRHSRGEGASNALTLRHQPRPSFNGEAAALALISHSGGKAVNARRMIYPAVVPVATITRTPSLFSSRIGSARSRSSTLLFSAFCYSNYRNATRWN